MAFIGPEMPYGEMPGKLPMKKKTGKKPMKMKTAKGSKGKGKKKNC